MGSTKKLLVTFIALHFYVYIFISTSVCINLISILHISFYSSLLILFLFSVISYLHFIFTGKFSFPIFLKIISIIRNDGAQTITGSDGKRISCPVLVEWLMIVGRFVSMLHRSEMLSTTSTHKVQNQQFPRNNTSQFYTSSSPGSVNILLGGWVKKDL